MLRRIVPPTIDTALAHGHDSSIRIPVGQLASPLFIAKALFGEIPAMRGLLQLAIPEAPGKRKHGKRTSWKSA